MKFEKVKRWDHVAHSNEKHPIKERKFQFEARAKNGGIFVGPADSEERSVVKRSKQFTG